MEQDARGKYNFILKLIFNQQGVFKGFNFVAQSFPEINKVGNLDLLKNKNKIIILNKFLTILVKSDKKVALIALSSIKKLIEGLVNNDEQKFKEVYSKFNLLV